EHDPTAVPVPVVVAMRLRRAANRAIGKSFARRLEGHRLYAGLRRAGVLASPRHRPRLEYRTIGQDRFPRQSISSSKPDSPCQRRHGDLVESVTGALGETADQADQEKGCKAEDRCEHQVEDGIELAACIDPASAGRVEIE